MFMEELWGLLLDAQNSLGGIPSAFLQEKKQEMLQAKVRYVVVLTLLLFPYNRRELNR